MRCPTSLPTWWFWVFDQFDTLQEILNDLLISLTVAGWLILWQTNYSRWPLTTHPRLSGWAYAKGQPGDPNHPQKQQQPILQPRIFFRGWWWFLDAPESCESFYQTKITWVTYQLCIIYQLCIMYNDFNSQTAGTSATGTSPAQNNLVISPRGLGCPDTTWRITIFNG